MTCVVPHLVTCRVERLTGLQSTYFLPLLLVTDTALTLGDGGKELVLGTMTRFPTSLDIQLSAVEVLASTGEGRMALMYLLAHSVLRVHVGGVGVSVVWV